MDETREKRKRELERRNAIEHAKRRAEHRGAKRALEIALKQLRDDQSESKAVAIAAIENLIRVDDELWHRLGLHLTDGQRYGPPRRPTRAAVQPRRHGNAGRE